MLKRTLFLKTLYGRIAQEPAREFGRLGWAGRIIDKTQRKVNHGKKKRTSWKMSESMLLGWAQIAEGTPFQRMLLGLDTGKKCYV